MKKTSATVGRSSRRRDAAIRRHARFLAEVDRMADDYVKIRRRLAECSARLDRLDREMREARLELEARLSRRGVSAGGA